MRFIKTIIVAGLLGLAASAWAAQTEVRLVLSQGVARPGDTVWAGVHLHMNAGWHTYWKNPGDAGQETKIAWDLPAGITAGEIQWPVPEKLTVADLVTYIYENDVVLLVPLKVAATLPPGPQTLKARVSWLECLEQCFPGKQDVEAALVIGQESKPSADAELIQGAQKKVPVALWATGWWEGPPRGDKRALIVGSPAVTRNVDFFPESSSQFTVEGFTETLAPVPGFVCLRKQVTKLEGDWPKEISGVIVEKNNGVLRAFEVKAYIRPPPPGAAGSSPSFSWAELLSQLGLAFLGGLVLNIMPCVLPVIALKIFSFVKQSGESPGRARALGFIYALGILCSFLVLAGFLIGIQKAGHVVSWGAQMQNPKFLVSMTIIVTLVALNLFGLFEVTLGSGTMTAASALTSKSGTAGAFFNGVLATVLAIPCTAPFLAGALAFAFGQPPGIIVLMFCFIALGLAAPYIVLSWNPKLLKFLPKPGPWMERFKVALGFPMLATVVWLYKLSLNHFSKSQSLWFGIFLVVLAMAAWIWGEFVQRGTSRRALAAVISLVLVAGVGAYTATRREILQWQPWSPAAVAQARADGHPVVVDFTADWCLTCQFNLRTSIDIPRVRSKLADMNAVTLIADYTREDESIGRELHRLGRDAVPLVVIFPKDTNAAPITLPPVLKPQLVLDALDQAAK